MGVVAPAVVAWWLVGAVVVRGAVGTLGAAGGLGSVGGVGRDCDGMGADGGGTGCALG